MTMVSRPLPPSPAEQRAGRRENALGHCQEALAAAEEASRSMDGILSRCIPQQRALDLFSRAAQSCDRAVSALTRIESHPDCDRLQYRLKRTASLLRAINELVTVRALDWQTTGNATFSEMLPHLGQALSWAVADVAEAGETWAQSADSDRPAGEVD
jgi:hypothetical protein